MQPFGQVIHGMVRVTLPSSFVTTSFGLETFLVAFLAENFFISADSGSGSFVMRPSVRSKPLIYSAAYLPASIASFETLSTRS